MASPPRLLGTEGKRLRKRLAQTQGRIQAEEHLEEPTLSEETRTNIQALQEQLQKNLEQRSECFKQTLETLRLLKTTCRNYQDPRYLRVECRVLQALRTNGIDPLPLFAERKADDPYHGMCGYLAIGDLVEAREQWHMIDAEETGECRKGEYMLFEAETKQHGFHALNAQRIVNAWMKDIREERFARTPQKEHKEIRALFGFLDLCTTHHYDLSNLYDALEAYIGKSTESTDITALPSTLRETYLSLAPPDTARWVGYELRSNRLDQAISEAYKITYNPVSYVQVNAAIGAYMLAHGHPEANFYLTRALHSLDETHYRAETAYAAMIDAIIPHPDVQHYLEEIEKTHIAALKENQLPGITYRILDSYATIGDQANAQRCLDTLAKQYTATRNPDISRGSGPFRFLIHATNFIKGQIRLGQDPQPTIQQTLQALLIGEHELAFSFISSQLESHSIANVSELMQLIDVLIQHGTNPTPLLEALKEVVRDPDCRDKPGALTEIIKQELAWATKQIKPLIEEERKIRSEGV